MQIVIVGAGEVGFNIARRLVEEAHDVMLVERDGAILDRATQGLDIQGVRGHGARPSVLEQAGVEAADMLIAVTDSDEVNMVACLNAAIFGRKDVIKIARVRDPGYLEDRFMTDHRVAIDLAINPERATADTLFRLLRFAPANELVDFFEGRVQLVSVPVTPTSPLAGLRVLELEERFGELDVLIAALHRGTEVIIPSGTDVILPGDEAYMVTTSELLEVVLSAFGVRVAPVRRVMIAGGSRVGRFVAEDLERVGICPKIIEPDARLAQALSAQLSQTVVICGEPTDAELLSAENVDEMEVYVAAGREEESNIMGALLARRLGAGRVFAVTNRADYVPILAAVGIDVSISPRLVAVNSILRYIRRGSVVAVRSLGEVAEAVEYEAPLTSDAVGTALHALKLPKNVLIAAIQRGSQAIIPCGDTVIEAGDHVLVIAHRSQVSAVERLFSRRTDRA